MNSWLMGVYPNQIEHSPQGMSPLHLDVDSDTVFPIRIPEQTSAALPVNTGDVDNHFASSYAGNPQQLVPGQNFMFAGPLDGE
jgi:hypothetical protein